MAHSIQGSLDSGLAMAGKSTPQLLAMGHYIILCPLISAFCNVLFPEFIFVSSGPSTSPTPLLNRQINFYPKFYLTNHDFCFTTTVSVTAGIESRHWSSSDYRDPVNSDRIFKSLREAMVPFNINKCCS